MNEGRTYYTVTFMCVSVYVSLLHDTATDGARTALAPCLETWLAPLLAPCYGLRQLNMYVYALLKSSSTCSCMPSVQVHKVLTHYSQSIYSSNKTVQLKARHLCIAGPSVIKHSIDTMC